MGREDGHRKDKRRRRDDDSRDDAEKRKSDKKKHSKRRRRRHDDDGSSSSSSSSDESERRGRKHRKKHKKEKKHRREEKKKRKRRKEEKHRREDSDRESVDPLERNHAFANALQGLLQTYPGMASEVPVILVRLAGGTSFNLDQMPDVNASRGLQQVLSTLSPFGVEKGEDGSWRWNAPAAGASQGDNELLLVKIARSLLDQIGITAEAVINFERREEDSREEVKRTQQALFELQSKTNELLRDFTQVSAESDETPSLAKEFADLCNMIMSGESISLDGLPDERLRSAMEQIFGLAGLEKSEMEGDSDDDGSDEDEPPMGYGLPDEAVEGARANMLVILEACKSFATERKQDAANLSVRGPASVPVNNGLSDDEDDDEDVGPAPVGSATARRRVQQGPSLPPEVIKAMAERRQKELGAVTGSGVGTVQVAGEREEWMIKPGEHEFLQGIKSGAPLKNRTFQNKKQSSSAGESSAPVHPAVQAEMDAIMEMHREARGPSLIEQHRLKKAEEKAAAQKKGGKTEWQWSRDKDLDEGRRVDKNALNMVMGGAAGGLKDKFQGGIGR